MEPILQRLIELERETDYQKDPPAGQPGFKFIDGSLPVMLSAPHGAAHWRAGRFKEEDEYTSALARLLAEQTSAHTLYSYRRLSSDPNADRHSPYKQALRQYTAGHGIKIVLHLHGCKPENGFGLALGTLKGSSCPKYRPLLLETLSTAGFSTEGEGMNGLNVDKKYPAMGDHQRETVTSFVWHKLHIEAVQFEINAHLRIVERLPGASTPEAFEGDSEGILHLVSTLTLLVSRLAAA
jgi:hypothetical protein